LEKIDIRIVLLFEHKSKPVDFPHLQLLKYLLKIWAVDIKQKKKSLTPVIPIIFYHGKGKWKSKTFEEYFKGIDENIERFLPAFDYVLTDLSKYSDEDIRNRYDEIKVRMALLLMKNIMNEQLLKQKIPDIFLMSNEVFENEEGEKFVKASVIYIYNNVEKGFKEITQEIETITTKGGDIAMTIAMQLEERGLQKGRQEGLYENQKMVITKLFTKGKFSSEQIANYLELDEKFVRRILKEAKLF